MIIEPRSASFYCRDKYNEVLPALVSAIQRHSSRHFKMTEGNLSNTWINLLNIYLSLLIRKEESVLGIFRRMDQINTKNHNLCRNYCNRYGSSKKVSCIWRSGCSIARSRRFMLVFSSNIRHVAHCVVLIKTFTLINDVSSVRHRWVANVYSASRSSKKFIKSMI